MTLDAQASLELIHRYEQALDFFEAGRLEAAAQMLIWLHEEYPSDQPVQKLQQAIRQLLRTGATNPQGLLLRGGEASRK